MNWLVFLSVGFIAGVIAKAITPGTKEEPTGWLLTLLLGIAGAFVGGFVGAAIGVTEQGVLGSILMSALGACVVIGLLRLFASSKSVI